MNTSWNAKAVVIGVTVVALSIMMWSGMTLMLPDGSEKRWSTHSNHRRSGSILLPI